MRTGCGLTMKSTVIAAAVFSLLWRQSLAADVLTTNGFSNCDTGSSTVAVHKADITFDRSTKQVTFNVAGTSEKQQDVTAKLDISAYGVSVYSNSFNPCDADTRIAQLCPIPQGTFAAEGNQTIPSEYASKIPSIAYNIPDVDIDAKMILTGSDGEEVACLATTISNGKTVQVPAVSYIAAGIAAAALVLSAASAAASGGHPGSSSSSPGFAEVMWWFQGMAMNGMHSVNYPAIYRSFSKNFAFSTGLVSWGGLQTAVDHFRQSTGGNTTVNSFQHLRNSTLQFPDGSTVTTRTDFARRAYLLSRDISTSINGTGNATDSSPGTSSSNNTLVSGIQGYVEQLTIPETNTFMTVLLVFAIIVAVIIVGILLFKVILEVWSIRGRLSKTLATFRKEYWRIMAQTLVQLVLLLYGTWTLYCIFQFTHGDSWAAQVLAGVTLGIFTAVLGFYTWKIFSVARAAKKLGGDTSQLFEDKPTWKKYRIFYENYRQQYWWLFVPFIVYMFAKGCVLAAADGHGLTQTAGQLVVESLMLIMLLWSRPYNRRSGNWINIVIQVVRVLSVAVILTFVEELGLSKTTATITGVVLVVVQASLTGILAILIAVNAIIGCVKENPHRKQRKAALKAQEAMEGDAFLMTGPGDRQHTKGLSESSFDFDPVPAPKFSRYSTSMNSSGENLVSRASPMGTTELSETSKGRYEPLNHARTMSNHGSPPPTMRQPTLPMTGYEQYRHM